MRARVQPLSLPLSLSLLVAALTGLCALGSDVVVTTAITALVLLVATVGLYMFVGNSGILSFGHAAFMMVGGYSASLFLLTSSQKKLLLPGIPGFASAVHTGPVVSCILGGLIAAALAALISIPIAKLSGIAGSLTTFAILGITYSVATNWEQVTGGPTGIEGIPITTTLGGALIWSLIAIFAAFLIQTARWGRRLRASREDEVAARAYGIGVRNERRAALVISAFFCGVAGGLYAEQLGILTPDTIYLDVTFLMIAMLVVGGVRSLSGAVIGSLTLSIVAEVLRRLEAGNKIIFFHFPGRAGLREVGLALIMLGVLVLRPNGITGGKELSWRAFSRRRSDDQTRRGPERGSPTDMAGPDAVRDDVVSPAPLVQDVMHAHPSTPEQSVVEESL